MGRVTALCSGVRTIRWLIPMVVAGCAGICASIVTAGCGDNSPPRADEATDAAPDNVGPDAPGVVVPDAASVPDAPADVDPTLPLIHDFSGTTQARARLLVRRALDGLGFDAAHGGPVPGDRVFVGRHYLAWIDQTGFYGKINGLWLLNGMGGEQLDFALADPDLAPDGIDHQLTHPERAGAGGHCAGATPLPAERAARDSGTACRCVICSGRSQ